MSRIKYGATVSRIMELLSASGPMTCSELCRELGLDRQRVSAILTRMRKTTERMPKRIHITMYVHDDEGARRYPRAVYALGAHPDAKPPKATRQEVRRRSDKKRRMIQTTNFVFNLALPRRSFK